MDFKGKTRFWLENMSRKLENFCMEGPMDLMENQLQIAQRSFRNLYSEFVEDVIPLITLQFNKHDDPDISLDQLSKSTDVTGHGEGSNIGIEGDQEDMNYSEVILSCRATDELCVDTPLQQCEETNLFSQIDESLIDTPLQEIEDNATKGRPSNLPLDVLKMVIPGIKKNLREEKHCQAEARMLVSPASPSVATGWVSKASDDQFALPTSMAQDCEDNTTRGKPINLPLDVLKMLIPGIKNNLHGEKNNPVEARILDSPAPPTVMIGGVSKGSDDQFAYPTPLPQEYEDFFSVEEVDAYDHISKFPAALNSSSGDSVSSDFPFSEVEPYEEYVDMVAFASLGKSGRRSDSTSAEEVIDDRVIEPAGMETTKPSDNELDRSCFNVNTAKESYSSSLKATYVSYLLHLKKRYREEAALEAKLAEKQEHEPQTVSFEDINAEADHRANKEGTVTIRPSLEAANEVVETSDEDSSDSDWEII